MFAQAVAGGLERLELGAPRQLLFELLIDVAAERVEPVQAAFQLFDEGNAGGDAADLRVELGDRLVQPGRFLRADVDQRHLPEDRVHLGLELRRARRERRHPLAERFEREAIGAQLVAQLRDLGVRLVELLHFLAEDVEVLAALLQRVHLPRRLLGHLVHLAEPFVQRLERELFLGQVVGLREQRLEAFGERVDLLRQRDRVLVLRREPIHARLGVADSGRERARAFVERLELLLLDTERVHLSAHRFEQQAGILGELARLALGLLAGFTRGLELGAGVLSEFLDAADRLFGLRRLLHPLVELADLGVHRPDHLVDAVGLHDRMLDGVLLAVECLGLQRHVLGKRVQRREPLFGALAQLVELRERAEPLLHLFDRRHRRVGVLACLAGGFAELAVVLREHRSGRPDLIELALERRGVAE